MRKQLHQMYAIRAEHLDFKDWIFSSHTSNIIKSELLFPSASISQHSIVDVLVNMACVCVFDWSVLKCQTVIYSEKETNTFTLIGSQQDEANDLGPRGEQTHAIRPRFSRNESISQSHIHLFFPADMRRNTSGRLKRARTSVLFVGVDHGRFLLWGIDKDIQTVNLVGGSFLWKDEIL